MAVATEVVWRDARGDQLQLGTGKSGPGVVLDGMRSGGKKRAWGKDTEKLMEFMIGQFSHGGEEIGKTSEVVMSTLDLLGTGGDVGGGVSGEGVDCRSGVDELLENEKNDHWPMPAGWEKCLHLKTGEIFYVNKSTGMRTSEDPRRYQRAAEAFMGAAIAPRTPARRPAHEFLASKKEETLRRRASTPGSGTSSGEDVNVNHPPPALSQMLSFSTGKRLWNLQLEDRGDRPTVTVDKSATSWNTSPRAAPFPNSHSPPRDESNLELNLNLSPARPSPSPAPAPAPLPVHAQTVCNLEMVQQALKQNKAQIKATTPPPPPPPLSTSSSFSSLVELSFSRSSPSTSSSSTSKSIALDNTTIPRGWFGVCSDGGCEVLAVPVSCHGEENRSQVSWL